MNAPDLLEEALALALKLSPGDRLRLVERVVSSVEREIEAGATAAESPAEGEHWGQNLIKLLETLDLSAWEALDLDDPVAWVQRQRDEEMAQRVSYWSEPE